MVCVKYYLSVFKYFWKNLSLRTIKQLFLVIGPQFFFKFGMWIIFRLMDTRNFWLGSVCPFVFTATSKQNFVISIERYE